MSTLLPDIFRLRFVSPNGNDGGDGLSWATAKRTILAAYDSLGEYSWVGGTIYIAGGSGIADEGDLGVDGLPKNLPGQGIWIMGPDDPNYQPIPNPRPPDWIDPLPKGWRRAKG